MADRTLREIKAALVGLVNNASDADTIVTATDARVDLIVAVSAISCCIEMIAAEYDHLSRSGLDVSRGRAAVDQLRAIVGAAEGEARPLRGAA